LLYSLDTSALLDGWKHWHPPDLFPSLWDRIVDSINNGDLRAIEEVQRELSRRDDDLYNWVKANSDLIIPMSSDVFNAASEIMQQFVSLVQKGSIRSQGDPFVIAFAKVNCLTVITGEKFGTKEHPKIPFVCNHYKIKCINIVDFIREQSWSF